MRNTWIFLDMHVLKEPQRNLGSTRVYVTEAYTEEEAWKNFARYAKGNFGLKDGSVKYVKEYFGDSIMLVKPDELVELRPLFPGEHM